MLAEFDYNDLISRRKTLLRAADGSIPCWGIYDFSYKYRTRIYEGGDTEIAYVEKRIGSDQVDLYLADGEKVGELIMSDDGSYVLDGIYVYEGDLKEGECNGHMKISDGRIETADEDDFLRWAMVLFGLVLLKR